MTFNLRTFALAALAAFASMTPALYAQNIIHAQVNVPFSFDYGTTHFGQGSYIITMSSQEALVVRNRSTQQTAMVLAQLDMSPIIATKSVVTFKKYGDRWFLEQVSVAGNGTKVSVCESKAERRAASELASRGGEATQVALVLLPESAFGK
ncbi:MAG TPA: hypothetical protein VHX13_00070 [Acidobacteriaceae bacterium]|jgi:hypothetical protein|nr:hypothetical protein [Acidobacteriaceae bacterium]